MICPRIVARNYYKCFIFGSCIISLGVIFLLLSVRSSTYILRPYERAGATCPCNVSSGPSQISYNPENSTNSEDTNTTGIENKIDIIEPTSDTHTLISQSRTVGSPLQILSWGNEDMSYKGNSQHWFQKELKYGPDIFQRCYQKGFLDISKQCVYTNDPKQINTSDIILFRGRLLYNTTLPTYRTPQQKWLFYEFEPPFKVWMFVDLNKYNGLFNLTSTYSRDSDAPNNVDYKICVMNKNKYVALSNTNFTSKKSRKVAWFSSVCQTQNRRFKYVKELKKYIQVDIYGKCGSLKCGHNNPYLWAEEKCHEELLHQNGSYKFYLAFENSFCDDYITEKLWVIQPFDVVPVVMGGVDYSNMMPKGSYIDAKDFASPKDLATFLNSLDRNDDLYNQYVRLKRSLDCTPIIDYMPLHCRICKVAHHFRGKEKVVHNLAGWWGTQRCTQPDLFSTGPRNESYQSFNVGY